AITFFVFFFFVCIYLSVFFARFAEASLSFTATVPKPGGESRGKSLEVNDASRRQARWERLTAGVSTDVASTDNVSHSVGPWCIRTPERTGVHLGTVFVRLCGSMCV
ncbi:unnamed protein product, partial [Ixodes persulcatus]